MKKIVKAIIGILTISLTLGNWLFATHEIIVKYKTVQREASLTSCLSLVSTKQDSPLAQVYTLTAPSENIDAKLKELNSQPDVAYAIKNIRMQSSAIVPRDPYYNLGQKDNLRAENMENAWGSSQGTSSVTIAVIDTGVDYTHPDLVGRVVLGHNYIANTEDPMDDHGHGTHVAGIIGANGNNGVGVAGIDWNCKILAIKVLDNYGSGWLSDVAAAVIEATDKGAKIINMSLGGGYEDTLMQEAIDYAYAHGVIVVAAAGNSGANLEVFMSSPVCNDGNANKVIGVGSVGKTKIMSYFSNYSSKYVDICSVGEAVVSTYPNGRYVSMYGTSMAAPQVSGVLGLLMAASPTATMQEIKIALFKGAGNVSSLLGQPHPTGMGYGMLDAYSGILSLFPTPNLSITARFYNYPNPVRFGGSTNFNLTCTEVPRSIDIILYSQSGKMVRTLIGIPSSLIGFVGADIASWDTMDSLGVPVPHGLYLAVVNITTVTGKQIKKVQKVVVK